MSDDAAEAQDDLIDPTFTMVRRGYDRAEVQRAIGRLVAELRAVEERERELLRRLAEAERRVDAVDPLDPSHLTKLLGDEVARILDAARAAAAEIRVRADDAATRLFEETKAEAAADAAAIIEQAQREARQLLDGVEQPVTRAGRVGSDRTAELFASLREQHEERP